MYKALYRTERPEVLSEVIGQEHIIRVIRNQLKTGKVGHAYLFCGTRGTGKTTLARLLAKGVNCTGDGDRPCGKCANCKAIQEGNFIDLVEVDAASNNGVDYIRNLRDSVNYPPTIGRKKVYIIDEVHMLSNSAFNAFLKTLEEPPEHVMFILATTDPQKITQTILSRCIRFDFKRVPEKQILAKMDEICQKRGVKMEEEALRLLASNADGSVRDGLSLLEQCLAGGDEYIDRDMILDFLGAASQEFFLDLTEKTVLSSPSDALTILSAAIDEGKDAKLLMMDWMAHYRSLLISKFIPKPEDMLNMSSENIARLKEQSSHMSVEEINTGIITLSRTINDAKYSTQPRILLELAVVTLASGMTAYSENMNYGVTLKTSPKSSKSAKATVKPPLNESKSIETETVEVGSKKVRDAKSQDAVKDSNQEQLGGMSWDALMAQAETFEDEFDDIESNINFDDLQSIKLDSTVLTEERGCNNISLSESADIDIEDAKRKIDANLDEDDAYSTEELDEIWSRVCNRATDSKPSLYVPLSGSALLKLSVHEIIISMRTEYAQHVIERDRELISDFVEAETGVRGPLKFKIAFDGEGCNEDDTSAEVAHELKDKWGLDVEIQ